MSATVVIPAYNYARWLPDAIRSALPQADVIVVDDGSTDDTERVASAFPAVRYIRQANQGLAAARNRGLDAAGTEYVCFLDADDVLEEGFISSLTAALADEPAAFAYSSIQMFGTDERRFAAPPWSVEQLKRQNYVSATSLFRVSALADVRFDSALIGLEDWDFALSLVERGLRGVPVPSTAFRYRKHSDEPSMFDRLGAPAEIAANRYITRKHRALYSLRERRRADLRWLKAYVVARSVSRQFVPS